MILTLRAFLIRLDLSGMLAAAHDAFSAWRERERSRHELLKLDARLRKDIGISYADAHHEAAKPFWRL